MYFPNVLSSVLLLGILILTGPMQALAREAVSGTHVVKTRSAQTSIRDDVLCKQVTDVKLHGDCVEWNASLEASILRRAETSCEGRPTEEFKSVAGLAACIAVEASKWRELETKIVTECGGFDARTRDKTKFDNCTKSKRPKWG